MSTTNYQQHAAPVRTRFAPSPTGYLHVGGIRTAIFAWLVARQANGQFILRLEDTDKNREIAGSYAHIIESLKALKIDYDEGPDIGGPHGPYRQSERLDIYKTWAQKLIDKKRAYADPYRPEEVQAFREADQKAKKPFLYRNHISKVPPVWDGTQPLRFRSKPRQYDRENIPVDAVMGELSVGQESIDDFILIKSDGYPTYNFAHIVDDAEMKITHVIRGQEFLASIPNYLNLYEALGLRPPIMATMPHVLGPDGKKKLSKRDGAKDVLDYIREGYLPEALINFIVSLGWNDGTDQEIFAVEELVSKFSLNRVQKGGAKFDEDRLKWMNGTYIRSLTLDDIYARCQDYWPEPAAAYGETYKKKVVALVQERLKYLAELPELTNFFFEDLPIDKNLVTGNKQLSKYDTAALVELLEQSKTAIEQSDFTYQDLTKILNNLLEQTGQKPGVLFSLIRIGTTAAPFSPPLAETMSVLGRETCLRRIDLLIHAL